MTSLALRAAAHASTLLIARARERSGSLVLGFHSSLKKGSGIDFVSHRAYSPGDDLRHIDRHALARHHKLLVREFEREAKRPVVLVFDGGLSMTYKSPDAAESKRTRAAFLASATAFVASRGRDPLGMLDLCENADFSGTPRSGLLERDRILERLGEYADDSFVSFRPEASLERVGECLGAIPRSSSVLWFSDFFDDLAKIEATVLDLATLGRSVSLVQIVDPYELEFPFTGPLHLTSKNSGETGRNLVTSAERSREGYLARFNAHTNGLRSIAESHRGHFAQVVTSESDEASIARMNSAFLGVSS